MKAYYLPEEDLKDKKLRMQRTNGLEREKAIIVLMLETVVRLGILNNLTNDDVDALNRHLKRYINERRDEEAVKRVLLDVHSRSCSNSIS